jgi:YD repeat-containing protein
MKSRLIWWFALLRSEVGASPRHGKYWSFLFGVVAGTPACLCLIVFALAPSAVFSQSIPTARYFYDAAGQLVRAVDPTGVSVEYLYDSAGNLIAIRRVVGLPATLLVFQLTPSLGGPGARFRIQGQGFSPVASDNFVTVNGLAATVLSATPTELVIEVPIGATTGLIAVSVGGVTATSSGVFTVLPIPLVSSITPRFSYPGVVASLSVTGVNLTGTTFSFLPTLAPTAIVVNSATVNAGGTTATLNVTTSASVAGSFVLSSSNAAGVSDPFPTAANTFRVLSLNGDEDHDGLSNDRERQLGTDPFNPDTDGDGWPDGVEVDAGSDPLSASSVPSTLPENVLRESLSAGVSLLNTSDPSQGTSDPAAAVREAAGIPISLLNKSDPSQGTSDPAAAVREAVAVPISILNTTDPSQGTSDPTAAVREAVAVPVSILNTTDPSQGSSSPANEVRESQSVFTSIQNTAQAQSQTASLIAPSIAGARIVGSSSDPAAPTLSVGGVGLSGALVDGQTVSVEVTPGLAGVQSADIFVNGVALVSDSVAPYRLMFTVPAGLQQVRFDATVTDRTGQRLTATALVLDVVEDRPISISGRAVGSDGRPMPGALATLQTTGLRAEAFVLDQAPESFPNFETRVPTTVKVVSALNVRNPSSMFGADPFGLGTTSDYAARFTGYLQVTSPGDYTLILGSEDAARLRIGGRRVLDLATGRAQYAERTRVVRLATGFYPLEVATFGRDGLNELQLAYIPPGGERQPITGSALIAQGTGGSTQTDPAGAFSIFGVPTAVDWVRVLVDDRAGQASGQSTPVKPLSGKPIDAGTIPVTNRSKP